MNTIWVRIAAAIVLIPATIFEYFVLIWFWGGDGLFTFWATPIAFIMYLIAHIVFMKIFHDEIIIGTVLKFSAVLLTPILSIATVWLIAKLLGIAIIIQ